MKKLAWILLICMFSVVCFTACAGMDDATKPSVAEKTENAKPDLGGETVIEIAGDDTAQNADGEGGLSVSDFGYIEFGYYPQTRATKDALKQMSKTTDATGYYVSEYDNEHYAKIDVADVYALYGEDGKNGYEFKDENPIVGLAEYYFKIEPVRWRVFAQLDLGGDLRNLYLVSEVILDSSHFLWRNSYREDLVDGEYRGEEGQLANNYAYSDLRKWITETFYKQAVSDWARMEGTNVKENLLVPKKVSELADYEGDEEDKMFVLTYQQAKLMEDLDSKILFAEVTDYARCRGTWMSVVPSFYGNGRYWLADAGNKSYRTCYVTDHTEVASSGEGGSSVSHSSVIASGETVGSTFMGVRPAIMITVDSLFEILQDEEE